MQLASDTRIIHLACASHYSIGHASGTPSQYARLASSTGAGVFGVAEFGTFRSLPAFAKAAKVEGVKLVIGVRLGLCADATKRGLKKEERERILQGIPPTLQVRVLAEYEAKNGYSSPRDLGHVTLWAKNQDGLQELFRVSSLAWLRGYYYEPRIDYATFASLTDNVIATIGGAYGPCGKLLAAGRVGEAFDVAMRLLDSRPGALVEVTPQPLAVNKAWNEFASRLPAPAILAHQVRYARAEDAVAQKAMHAITNPRIEHFHDAGLAGSDWFWASEEEMRAWIDAKKMGIDFDAAAQVAREVADACEAKYAENPFACITPPTVLEAGETPASKLERLARAGIQRCKPEWPVEYEERLVAELRQLERQKFVGYVLYVNDVVALARELNIAIGPGRGSAAGSLVLWLLGITSKHLDPIKYGLLFSRFVDPQRVAPPDVDLDFDNTRRGELIEALRVRYGSDNVSHITNFNTMRGRACVKDVCRALGVDLQSSRALADAVDDELDEGAIALAFEQHEYAKSFDRRFPEVKPICLAIEGAVRSLSMHAGGVVCSPVPMYELIPVETRASDEDSERILVTAYDMKGVDSSGLLKLDALGLKTVGLLRDAQDLIRRRVPTFNLDEIDVEDARTLEAFTRQDFSGVFQYDTHSSYKLCNGVTFVQFEDVSTLTALNRPGPLDCGMADAFIERRKNNTPLPEPYGPAAARITEPTLGVIVYQEQIMQIAVEVAGYENPDGLRKMVGKKLLAEMEAEGPKFVAGCVRHSGLSQEAAQSLWGEIETAGRYVFNRSHSAAYALIAYMCQFLKVHYPAEFYCAALNIESDANEIRAIVRDAVAHGVEVAPPHVNWSQRQFDVVDGRIVASLLHLTGVGETAVAEILRKRPYISIDDFLERIERTKVNAKVIKTLAQAGALGELIANPRAIVDGLDDVSNDRNKKRRKWTTWSEGFATFTATWTDVQRRLNAATVNPTSVEDPFGQLLAGKVVDIPDDWDDSDGTNGWFSGCVNSLQERVVEASSDRNDPESRARVGKPFLVFELVGDKGKRARIKVEWCDYQRWKPLLKNGAFIAVHATIDARWKTLRPHSIVNLAAEIEEEGGVTPEGAALLYYHPLTEIKDKRATWNLKLVKQQAANGIYDAVPIMGLVLNVRPRLDKNGNEMASVGILHASGEFTEFTVFQSDWKHASAVLQPGRMVIVEVEPNEWKGSVGWVLTLDDDSEFGELEG